MSRIDIAGELPTDVTRRNANVTKLERCPTCGHPIGGDAVANALAGRQRMLYEIIRDAGTLGIDRTSILSRLYADAEDGGPMSRNIVAVTANHTNKKLVRFGLKIRGTGGPGSLWRLVIIGD